MVDFPTVMDQAGYCQLSLQEEWTTKHTQAVRIPWNRLWRSDLLAIPLNSSQVRDICVLEHLHSPERMSTQYQRAFNLLQEHILTPCFP